MFNRTCDRGPGLGLGLGVLLAVAAALTPPGTLAAAGAEKKVTSKIESVTLYRGQALVTRAVTLPEGGGEMELVVPDLPSQVVPESLFASGEGVKVRSVRSRAVATAGTPRKEVADLDAQIKQVQEKVYVNQQMQTQVLNRGKYLDKLENFIAPTMQVELAKGVLDAKQITELTEFILKQRATATTEAITLHKEAEGLTADLSLVQRKRIELAGDNSRAQQEAVVFLTRDAAGAGTLKLSYLAASANWQPAYDFRLDAEGANVQMDYLAQVAQASGEDWTDVKLTLSTATPAMNAEMPLVSPMWIKLLPGGRGMRVVTSQPSTAQAEEYNLSMETLKNSQYGALSSWQSAAGDQAQAGWELNRISAEAQKLEMLSGGKGLHAGMRTARATEEGLAVAYEITGKMSLASRNDTQLVQIMSAKLAGKPFFQAIPLLTTYVYRGEEVANTTNVPLLAGPYSAYVAGEFVGRGALPLVAKGQTLAIGFGVDTQLRCSRELKDKTDETKLGSKVQTYNYVLHLESYKDKPVQVRLMDRIPASKGEEMDVHVVKTVPPLSTDTEYIGSDDKAKGILRWDVPVPAAAAGAKAVKVEYSFEMKYADDRNLNPAPAQMMDEMKREFDVRFKLMH
jgi:hypothetical protein